jgi:hypothetical protein
MALEKVHHNRENNSEANTVPRRSGHFARANLAR